MLSMKNLLRSLIVLLALLLGLAASAHEIGADSMKANADQIALASLKTLPQLNWLPS